MRFVTHCIPLLVLFIIACNSTNNSNQSNNDKPNTTRPHTNNLMFASSIPPEFVRIKGSLIRGVEPLEVKSTGVDIHFKVLKVLGYGATFSKRLQPSENIIAFTKFGHDSLKRSSLDSLKEGTSFIAEMEGNPLIPNQYTIYKLQLTK